MSKTVSQSEYYAEVQSLAQEALDQAIEAKGADASVDTIRDAAYDIVHEVTDGHAWVIYYAQQNNILDHSENDSYGLTEGLMEVTRGMTFSDIKTQCAAWALYADVQEKLGELLDEYEPTEAADEDDEG